MGPAVAAQRRLAVARGPPPARAPVTSPEGQGRHKARPGLRFWRVGRARLEAEATRAATRVCRGHKVAAGDLSSAIPAPRVPGEGARLPGAVRDRLERSFTADLTAVRVHQGPSAAAVVGANRARALGAHIYLGTGESSSAPASFPVLAHEVAHVLQQTAVPTGDGRLRARDVSGAGEALAWEAPFADTGDRPDTRIHLTWWREAAREAGESDAVERIDALLATLVAAGDTAAFWQERAVKVRSGSGDSAFQVGGGSSPTVADLPAFARSALYDGLKLNGQPAAAARLLRDHEDVQSGFLDVATYLAYVNLVGTDRLLDRILHVWATEPVLGQARPNKALALTMAYLLGAFNEVIRTPIHEEAGGAENTYLADDLRQVLRDANFLTNELQEAAFYAIVQMEEVRRDLLTPTPGAVLFVTGESRTDERATVANNLVRWSHFVAEHEDGVKEGTEEGYEGLTIETRHLIVRDMAPAFGEMGMFALEFWRGGQLAVRASQDEQLDAAAGRGVDAETLQGIGGTPEPFPGLRQRLLSHARVFFRRLGRGGALPDPPDYERLVQSSQRSIGAGVLAVQRRMILNLSPAWNPRGRPLAFDPERLSESDAELRGQGAFLIVALLSYVDLLGGYSRAADEDYAQEWRAPIRALVPPITQWPAEDLRNLHRARVAGFNDDAPPWSLLAIATIAGLDEVADIARGVVTATETWTGGRQSQDVLALAPPFDPEPLTPVSRLAEDMQGNSIAGWEQFTVDEIVLFFQGDRLRRISEHISTLLGGPEGSRFERDQAPILNRAIEAEQSSLEQPLRHSILSHSWAYLRPLPSSQEASAGSTTPAQPREPWRLPLRKLIEHHPVTRVTVKDWSNWLIPARQGEPDIVVWRLPRPVHLARFLRAIPAVNELLARYSRVDTEPPATPLAAADFAAMGDDAWWAQWRALVEEGATAVERRRTFAFKAIPEVDQKLAEYAQLDVSPPETVPTATSLTALDDDAWFRWFVRLTDVSPSELWRTRNLGFRRIPALTSLLEEYAAREAQPGATSLDFPGMGDDTWLDHWERLTRVGLRRRTEVGRAVEAAGLEQTLRTEYRDRWAEFQERQREALVHERERIVRSRVEPLLTLYDATASITETGETAGREVRLREAAAEAMWDLQTRFLYAVPEPSERVPHQVAALLRIAPLLRSRLVEGGPGEWVMQGWDRSVAWAWLPLVEEVLDRIDSSGMVRRPVPTERVTEETEESVSLTPWLRSAEISSSGWVEDRRQALADVYDGLFATMSQHREQFGFVAVAGDGTIENPGHVHEVDGSRRFGPAEEWNRLVIDGVEWELVGAPVAFSYNPGLINRHGRMVVAPRLVVDGSEVVGFDEGLLLLRVTRDGVSRELYWSPRDEPVLREFAFAVMLGATVEQLVGLAEGIEEGTMFVVGLAIDVAEFFPVAGQAAAVARVVLVVGSVLGDRQFRELSHALLQDPQEALQSVWTALTGSFDPGTAATRLAEALILDPGLERLEGLANQRPPRRRTGRTTSRVGRILRRLMAVGRGMASALGRIVGFAHDVRDDIQAFVLEHLFLGRILDLIADYIHSIGDVPRVLGELDLNDLPGRLARGVREKFDELIQTVGQVRLPERLVTLDDVVGIFLDIVGRRLGGKYRLGYFVIRALLEAVDKWNEVVGMISQGIRRVLGTDPTDYINFWATFVNEYVQPYVQRAQVMLHEVLSHIYGAVPGHTDELSPLGPVNLTLQGDQFLDAAPARRAGAPQSIPWSVELDLSGGQPLARVERQRFEHQFGQDLSHVRLHRSRGAERATVAAGAHALTSGSHIVLAPDVLPDSDAGRRVIRHELVHVLQQTGPRTLGIPDDRPVGGEPGLGLRIDPRAEALAEEIASSERPVRVAPSPGGGVQPSLGMGQRFIDYLVHVERTRPEIERIQGTGGGTGSDLIAREVRDDVANLGQALRDWIDGFGRNDILASRRDTFGSSDVVGLIRAWMQSKATAIDNAVEDLAIDASETERRRRDVRETPVMHLREEGLERKLQRFIAGATGCFLDVELELTTARRLNRARPLASARLLNINPALIPDSGAGAGLWTELMNNSYPPPWQTARTDVNVRAYLRILLFARGQGEDIWDNTGFKVTIPLAIRARETGREVATLTLPTAARFWHGGQSERPADLALTSPALWIGKHGDATHHGQKDRQSHHTTQYLLIEYFSQKHARKPFPDLNNAAIASVFHDDMGFQIRSGRLISTDRGMKVGELDPNSRRGSEMPAILISAVAHQRGRLHVTPSLDEDSSSPSGVVETWFRAGLASRLGSRRASSYWEAVDALAGSPPTSAPTPVPAPTVDPIAQPLGWLKANAGAQNGGADLKRKVPLAMKHAYRQMRDHMLPAIKPALEHLEKTWYETLVEARHHGSDSAYRITPGMINRVAEAAKENNRRIMEHDSKWGTRA